MKSKNFLSIFLILLILFKGFVFSIKYTEDSVDKEYTLFVQSLKTVETDKVSYYVIIQGTQDKFILNIYNNKYSDKKLDLNQYANYSYGDTVKVKGKIKIPKMLNNPGEFNYKLYLYSNNIHGQINTYAEVVKEEYEKNIREKFFGKIYKFKDYINELISKSMGETNANVAKALIYGEKTELEEVIKEDFESLGVSHLMSVSGAHITSFMCVVNFILNTKKKSKVSNIKRGIIILLIILYVVFTGSSVSSLRAGIMLITSVLCDMFKKQKNIYKSLFLSLIVILLISPFAIFNIGTKLSYLAVLGIVMFKKEFEKILRTKDKVKNEVLKRIIKTVIENIAITLSVQFLIFPIQITAFNGMSIPITISNFLVGILSMPIRILGTIGIVVSFIPSLSLKIFSFIEFFVIIMLKIINILKQISFFIPIKTMPFIWTTMYYLFIASLFFVFKIKRVMHKIKKYNFKNLYKKLKTVTISLFIIVILSLVYVNIYSIYFSEYVYFFNVEQGDMSYIKSKTNSIIVDIGSMNESLAFNTISNFFKSENISYVDLIILSHMDSDHINGLESFLAKYDVGEIVYSLPKEETEKYIKFKEIVKKHNVKTKVIKAGDEINLKNIKIQILLPGDTYIEAESSENENSLVCKITVGDTSMLYMGDAGVLAEEKLTKNSLCKIDILKVGHHGSKTATSDEFIKHISPTNAVISASKKYYGHPHESVLQTLKQNGVYTYITEKMGAVRFNLK